MRGPFAHVECSSHQPFTDATQATSGDLDFEIKFVEVKTVNDSLQPNQRGWMRLFAASGIPSGVIRVEADT